MLIIYETGKHYIIKTDKAYEVYRNTTTAAIKCATIGLSLGLDRAIAEVTRREVNFVTLPTTITS
jgi:hypothetical protein